MRVRARLRVRLGRRLGLGLGLGHGARLAFGPLPLLLRGALGREAVQLEVRLELRARAASARLSRLPRRAAAVSGCGRLGPRLRCSPRARGDGCECQAADRVAQLRARGRQGGRKLLRQGRQLVMPRGLVWGAAVRRRPARFPQAARPVHIDRWRRVHRDVQASTSAAVLASRAL